MLLAIGYTRAAVVLTLLLEAALIGLIGGSVPALRAASLKPVEALRSL
ncbi:MAG: hypothetical protein O3A20_00535 [Planctomycetota bacterium]|nr:hypothetical protein [Planctomycetota bacterium]